MLDAVDPLLHRIEAMAEQGCYVAAFVIAGGQERSIVLRVVDGEVSVPEANMIAGWTAEAASFQAVLSAVLAVDRARTQNDAPPALLRDVPGGWDVGVGNVELSPDGRPMCVAHGELESTQPGRYECRTCGACALFGDEAGSGCWLIRDRPLRGAR